MRWIGIILSGLLGTVARAAATTSPGEEFANEIRPVLEKHCYECHNSEKHKGDLNLAAFETYDDVVAVPEVWATALERVQAFEMPPKGKKDLSFDQNRKLTVFFRGLPKPDRTDCNQLASDRSANFYRGY